MHYFVINFLLISSASMLAMAGEQTTGGDQKQPRTCSVKGRTGSYTITFPEADEYPMSISTDLAAVIACIAAGDWDALRKNTERLKRLEHGELETVQNQCGHRQSAIQATEDLWSNSTIEEYVRILQAQLAVMPDTRVKSNYFPDIDEGSSYIPNIDRVKSAQRRKWKEEGPLNDDHESALGIFDMLDQSRSGPHIATLLQSLATKGDDEAVAYILQESEEAAATVAFLRIIKKEEWVERYHGARINVARRRNAMDVREDQEIPTFAAMQCDDDGIRARATMLAQVDGDVPSLKWWVSYFD